MIREVIYKDRDNSIDLQLSSDSGNADFSGVTKVELVDTFGGLAKVTSEGAAAGYFDWSTGDGILKLSLGKATGLVSGKVHRFNIILYDPDNTNGVNWGFFQATVK